MLRLAKAFWDISLWRRTPDQLPASLLLLSLVAGAAALLEVLSALQPPISIKLMFARVVLSVGLPLAFVWVALVVAHRRQRFLQTGIAVLGVDVLAGLILYPIGSLIHLIGPDSVASVPLGILMLIGLVWYLLACANIWRSALDAGIGTGIVVSVGYFLMSILLGQQLLPHK
jgi:hypothetical protein